MKKGRQRDRNTENINPSLAGVCKVYAREQLNKFHRDNKII